MRDLGSNFNYIRVDTLLVLLLDCLKLGFAIKYWSFS